MSADAATVLFLSEKVIILISGKHLSVVFCVFSRTLNKAGFCVFMWDSTTTKVPLLINHEDSVPGLRLWGGHPLHLPLWSVQQGGETYQLASWSSGALSLRALPPDKEGSCARLQVGGAPSGGGTCQEVCPQAPTPSRITPDCTLVFVQF